MFAPPPSAVSAIGGAAVSLTDATPPGTVRVRVRARVRVGVRVRDRVRVRVRA